jgi:disulfide bond formation protein DsbB
MSVMSLSLNRTPPAAIAAFLVALGAAATILGAFYFQYVLNLPPCPMCLEERIPHYIVIPLGLIVAIAALRGAPRNVVRAGLAIMAIAMLVLVVMSVFHAGVEWKWWPGPTDCTGPVNNLGNAGDLLSRMNQTVVIRCDEAAWRLFGISLAGYNALISLALAAIATWGIFARPAKA